MSKELIVSSGPHETRVAILEDDQVVELFHEREKEYSLAGSIHKGRVTRVLPGMQSAFVDIGLERDAFLYVSDFFEDNDEYDAVVSTVEEKVLKMEKGGDINRGDINRIDRPEPVRQSFAAPSVEAPAGEAAVSPAASGNGSGAETRQETRQQEPGREGRPDRGGRGRRGRRRRGGRGSGLPESKFFSPGAEAAKASAAGTEADNEVDTESDERIEPEQEPGKETAAPVSSAPASRAVPSEDFMVLPGESLAKYSPSEAAEPNETDNQDSAPEEEPTAATLSPVESALPEEHPLAGFGSVASWINPSVEEAVQPEAVEPEEEQPVVEVQAIAEVQSDREPVNEETADAEESPDSADEGLDAAEVAEAELAAEVAAEVFENEGAPVEEGPEPARIPTSLTATLREQGHRYPHRVSRRMRRKMRGSPQGEEGEKQPSHGAPPVDAGVEDKIVAPQREERRPPASEPREQREPREPREPRGEPRQQDQRGAKDRPERDRPERERPPLPSISDLLKEGQEIIVQIAKEPLGQKGARITSHIALPGRFVVYMPTVEHVGVSRKIPSDEERQRLKRILQTHRQGIPGGFICRTAAENKSEEELKSDMHFLYNLWLDMRQKAEKKPAPVLLHHDLDLVQRILRDQLTTSFKTIWVDNEELYESILRFVERFQPALVGRVKLYTRSNPIFDEFGITSEVEKALRPKVWLKSGGYIVINQTEALVAIDINTGQIRGQIESPRRHHRQDQYRCDQGNRAADPPARSGRHHRGGLHRHGRAQESPEGDDGARRRHAGRSRALQNSAVQRFRTGGDYAQAREAVARADALLALPVLRRRGLYQERAYGDRRDPSGSAAHAEGARGRTVEPRAARESRSCEGAQEQPELISCRRSKRFSARSVLVKSDPLLHQTKFDLA